MPKISVLMPIFKTPDRFLREAVESVLNQTFENFEFLILDDCPEDNRQRIIKSYADPRIRYYQNSYNKGITASRNRLIDLAKGEYLAVFDHDDISAPTRFERQVQFLDNHPEIGIVGGKSQEINRPKMIRYPTRDDEIKLGLMSGCMMVHSSVMIRKSVLTENHIYYEEKFSPAEDYALFCRLISKARFHNLNDEVLLYYRNYANNTSHLKADQMRQATLSVWAFVRKDNPVLFEEFLLKAEHTHYYRLFGLIPWLVVRQRANDTKAYLFGKFLVFSTKSNMKLRGGLS